MRHQKAFRKFGRSPAHRRALLRNLATSFFRHEQIETTLPKAKDLRPIVERLITLARKDTLHARRQALAYLLDKPVVHKLFAVIAPSFHGRPGGYTRVLRTRQRMSDAAEMALIELVVRSEAASSPSPEKKKSTSKKRSTLAPSEKQEAASETDVEKKPKQKASSTKASATKKPTKKGASSKTSKKSKASGTKAKGAPRKVKASPKKKSS